MKTTPKRPNHKDFQLVTGAKVRNARYTQKPAKYWLDVGKHAAMELTALKHGFAVKGESR